ncbi:hypothetical protein Gocc_2897 [Gaiella occulta]|uniref:Uncharacterized protein n=1 Tax=Gaiella occulta TaxID=1002870 RepID=A0A7M2YUZ6_9ACTN|nr:hypothetical protein [Gaiella occulta]RDI73297.1 hypothetical protein Gocc_2897 [Gaiella occulta]
MGKLPGLHQRHLDIARLRNAAQRRDRSARRAAAKARQGKHHR